MNQLRHDFQQRQNLSLAPRLQQSVKFLQMSALEFQQAVQQALATNPFLEETEEEAQACVIQLDDAAPEHYGDYPRPAGEQALSDSFDREPMAWSLQDRLLAALSTLPLSPRDQALAIYLIDALDADGYLRTPLHELPAPDAFDPPPDPAEWQTTLKLVQQLDVPGIGARSLAECLMLQLRAAPAGASQVQALALQLVDQHLARLARNDLPGLRRELNVSDDLLEQACDCIRALNPKPGLFYDERPTAYVMADVLVDKSAGRWRVRANEAAKPRARLHNLYVQWFRKAHQDERGPLVQELQEARWILRNVEQRYSTICRVAEAILKRQKRFFEYGDVALRPLMLREVADDLEIHESTVSRATTNKYMMTPRGLFEFRHFFSRKLDTDTGGSCSASAVRAIIGEMVEREDPRQPLSDVDLTRQLAGHGIQLARRTVTKYRDQQGIPPAELRRSYVAA